MKILIEESVLRQALEALIDLNQQSIGGIALPAEIDSAMDALRSALDDAEKVEPIFAFRRKGQDAFCTCDKARYRELTGKSHLFETTTFYPAPAVPEGGD